MDNVVIEERKRNSSRTLHTVHLHTDFPYAAKSVRSWIIVVSVEPIALKEINHTKMALQDQVNIEDGRSLRECRND